MRLGVSQTTVLFVATVLMIILANSSTPLQALATLLVNHAVAVPTTVITRIDDTV
jgi:hypothetical protein